MVFNIFGREIYIKKLIIAAAIIVLIALTGLLGKILSSGSDPIVIDKSAQQSGSPAADNATAGSAGKDQTDSISSDEIKIYVVGCVKHKGVVTLKKGQIIADAIEAAGGATAEADLESINLAYELSENAMLNIYPKAQKQTNSGIKTAPAPKPSDSGGNVPVTTDSGGAVIDDNNSSESTSGMVNINTATAAELDTLPGIGEKTAESIISYRKENGRFKIIEDIMKVPRIKEGIFNQIKDFIKV